MNVHHVIDIETLDLSQNALILSIGIATVFEKDRTVVWREDIDKRYASLFHRSNAIAAQTIGTTYNDSMGLYYIPLSISDQEAYRTVNPKTVEWHQQFNNTQSDYNISKHLDVYTADQLDLMWNYLNLWNTAIDGRVFYWAWHSTFDFGILNDILAEHNLEQFDDRQIHDIPTLARAFNIRPRHKHPHTAVLDAAIECCTLIDCWNYFETLKDG
jgi:DNA polymerase III epsilon subunit-like protein